MEHDHEELIHRMTREEKIEEGLKLLQQRCEFAKLRVIHMEDDGNCQFRALAHELFGSQKHHDVVRSKVLEHMRAHEDEYSMYVGDTADWEAYLAKMSRTRCWGDELTVRAASDAFGVVIHVVTTEHDNWLLHYGSDNVGPGVRECFLAYVSPIHYNVVTMLEEGEKVGSVY